MEETKDRPRNELGQFISMNGHPDRFQEFEDNTDAPLDEEIISSPLDVVRTFFSSIQSILLNSDIAYQQRRTYQRMMRRDPDVMAPLLQRQYAVALLPWSIVAEDPKDKKQKDEASHIESLIRRNMRRPTDYFRFLMEADWYGPSAVNIQYSRVRDGIAPTTWIPFHPDTLSFDKHGRLGLKVGYLDTESTAGHEIVQGPESRVRMLSERERASVVLHTFMEEGPDFEEGREARVMYSGIGLRDKCFFTWLVKMKVLQNWANWAERFASGVAEFHYPESNKGAPPEINRAVRNFRDGRFLMLPVKNGWPEAFAFKLNEAKAEGQKTVAMLIDWLSGNIKELLIGQTATTEPSNEGLGTGTSTQHAETFYRITKYGALNLGDTLTREFVKPLHRMNFPGTIYSPRFEFSVQQIDTQDKLAAIEKASNMGVDFVKDEIRNLTGMTKPEPDDDTVGGMQNEFGMDQPFGGALKQGVRLAARRDMYAGALK